MKEHQKTYLVFSDIHNRSKLVEPIISTLRARGLAFEKIIFLGDYFDSFGDTTGQAEETAEWLHESLQKEDRVHLIGNHDLPYLLIDVNKSREPFPKEYYCPGYRPDKAAVIRNIITEEDLGKFKAMYFAADFLLSHAGIVERLIPADVRKYGDTDDEAICNYVNLEYTQLVVNKGFRIKKFPLFLAGSRMGHERPGGVIWSDWEDEFLTTAGINQIVGHTPGAYMRTLNDIGSVNHAVDTHNRHVYILTEGSKELTVIPIDTY